MKRGRTVVLDACVLVLMPLADIPAMTNHPKDRHVLAAAARAGAKVMVTYNLKDFPSSSLARMPSRRKGHQLFSRAFTIWPHRR